MSKLDESFLKRLERDRSNPWHRVIVEAERLLNRIQDPDISETLDMHRPFHWNLITEAAHTLEGALARAQNVAPAEPTDAEINEAIARKLGWHVPTKWKGFADPEGISCRHDCITTDLHFALKALRDLPINLGDVNILGTDCGVDVEWGIGEHRTGQRNLTPEQAARRLSRLLFERITNADGEDETERARR